jgi:hypothetical protein
MASRLSSFTHWVQAVAEGAPVQPLTVVVVVMQLANTPLRQEPPTRSLLVKVANGKHTLSRLHSLEQPHVVMQVLVVAPLEWGCLIITKLGPRAAGDQRFSWLLERTTSLVQVVVVAAVTPLQVVQVEEPLGYLESNWEIPVVMAGLKLPAARLEMGRTELPASNTQVVMQAPLQPALQEVKVAAAVAVGTAAAAVATTLVAVVAQVTLHF